MGDVHDLAKNPKLKIKRTPWQMLQQSTQTVNNKSYTDPVTIIDTVKGAVQLNTEPAPVKMGVIFYEAATSNSNTFLG